MEADRLETDLGIAADIEEAQILRAQEQQATKSDTANGEATTKQPKKRFVGRRTAAEAAAKNDVTGSAASSSTAVESTSLLSLSSYFDKY